MTAHADDLDACAGAQDLCRDLRRQLEGALASSGAQLLEHLGDVINSSHSDLPKRYSELPAPLNEVLTDVRTLADSVRLLALRCAVAAYFRPPEKRSSPPLIPESVAERQVREHRRILDELRQPECTADLASDRWRKNIAILDGRLLPVGAEFADIHSGLPRRLLFTGGAVQVCRMLRCVSLETRGFKPMFELHAHPDCLDDFHPKGWLHTYARLAALLELNPQYRGVMASSWFRDPALAKVSPRLRYLRDYPEAYGARMFRIGTDTEGTSGALARSPTRRLLFAQGHYVPAVHLMIWPREALLSWARTAGA